MASLLRKIVAGPRARHAETGLDLCYVTDEIIATSGPSSAYPQLAYRNPLKDLVKYLDARHNEDWAIWEFRAEGTGYPDEEVYGRVWHYPWPDHHPPPFAIIPSAMASMRNWLKGGNGRVVVVHCKAGKGRSGTMACSYLISECEWDPADALERFTERRMRAGFGQGVSIPSQLRWIDYVKRWTHNNKVYVERPVEIVEVHVWGLREGVKVSVMSYIDEGKTIKTFYVFDSDERIVCDDNADDDDPYPENTTKSEKSPVTRRNGSASDPSLTTTTPPLADPPTHALTTTTTPSRSSSPAPRFSTQPTQTAAEHMILRPSAPLYLPTSDINLDFEQRRRSLPGATLVTSVAHVWFNAFFEGAATASESPTRSGDDEEEAASSTTATTNTQTAPYGAPSGTFAIAWDAMDGIKGSSRKGTRCLDRLEVRWRVVSAPTPTPTAAAAADATSAGVRDAESAPATRDAEPEAQGPAKLIREPTEDEEVRAKKPADWRGMGAGQEEAERREGRDVGLREDSPRR
ncbi:MAG: Telomerase protein component 1 [Piccolia ochrophora]|nr:MAG: Telomerase protein component 1 [Piccolia ochrophora]